MLFFYSLFLLFFCSFLHLHFILLTFYIKFYIHCLNYIILISVVLLEVFFFISAAESVACVALYCGTSTYMCLTCMSKGFRLYYRLLIHHYANSSFSSFLLILLQSLPSWIPLTSATLSGVVILYWPKIVLLLGLRLSFRHFICCRKLLFCRTSCVCDSWGLNVQIRPSFSFAREYFLDIFLYRSPVSTHAVRLNYLLMRTSIKSGYRLMPKTLKLLEVNFSVYSRQTMNSKICLALSLPQIRR